MGEETLIKTSDGINHLRVIVLRALSFVHITNNNKNSRGGGDSEGFDWKSAIADALIIAGLNFFSTLSALGSLNITRNTGQAILAALVSAGLGFFTTLAIKRGLKSGPA